jgi:hypothetical protein
MSNKPIPPRLWAEFLIHMDAHDLADVSDGVWWAMLEEAAEAFIQQHGIDGDPFYAVHQYLQDESSSKRGPRTH